MGRTLISVAEFPHHDNARGNGPNIFNERYPQSVMKAVQAMELENWLVPGHGKHKAGT